ncbi:MAG: hypothetical protein GY749_47850, partial [Desulfobacteraceae bacterium]|nr:hypothetical protein [Desulfobacteraceae bacterium]
MQKRKQTCADLTERIRKIPVQDHADKMEEMIRLCSKSRFNTVWMNYYIQVPHTTALEADVLAEGEDEETCWALVFEIKNRDEKNPPVMNEAELFATKVNLIKQTLEKKNKKILFVCPVYLSAKGFDSKVETWLHSNGILTADLETWELS